MNEASGYENCVKTRQLPQPHLHCTERSAVQVWPVLGLLGIECTLCWDCFGLPERIA